MQEIQRKEEEEQLDDVMQRKGREKEEEEEGDAAGKELQGCAMMRARVASRKKPTPSSGDSPAVRPHHPPREIIRSNQTPAADWVHAHEQQNSTCSGITALTC